MASRIKSYLPDELSAFVDTTNGNHLTGVEKMRSELIALRNDILEGYGDVIDDRCIEFKGDLAAMLDQFDQREASG